MNKIETNKNKRNQMEKCQRCDRRHRGLCGIPRTTTIKSEIGIGNLNRNIKSYSESWKIKMQTKKINPEKIVDTHTLEKLLEMGKDHYKKVMEMLKIIPPTESVYTELLDKESKLKNVINQILGQIVVKKYKQGGKGK